MTDIKFKNKLESLLKQDSRLVDENMELNLAAIRDLSDKTDSKLIELLLSSDEATKKFFLKAKDVLVFKQNDFKFFLDSNQIDNSYTAFENRIGLASGNRLLKDSSNVVLNFPFKDGVLEGGQSTEEGTDEYFEYNDEKEKYEVKVTKRKEIFFNEVLAQDEIDRLFEPKAFADIKKYTAKGEEKIKSFARNKEGVITDNLIIKGNNLLTLHCLREEFSESIKLIYIDPPYNTAGDNNTFAYNNNFNHSAWLTFMKNRLEVARDLLTDDGVVAIAIDDEEYAHLKVLCDDIFKRENYVGTIVVQSNPRGRTTNTHFATSHEYTLFYGKNLSAVEINYMMLTKEQELDFGDKDDTGDFRFLPFRRSGGTSTPKERENSEFTLYYSKSKKNIIAVGGKRKFEYPKEYAPENILSLDSKGNMIEEDEKSFISKHDKDLVELMPVDTSGKRRVWRWADRLEILKAAKAGDFNVVTEKGKFTVQLKDRIKDGRKPKTIWYDSKYDASSNGTMLLKKLFNGEKVFSYPKSLHAVKDTIEIITARGSDDIVLDFFGGSGTTAQAVLDLNKEDNGNRRFVLCEQMDYVETVTTKRVQKIIKNNKNGSFIYLELAKWNSEAKEKIAECGSLKELEKLLKELSEKYFLHYNVKFKEFKEKIIHEEAFKNLSLKKQQEMFCKMLDLNQLYVNASEMEDKNFGINKDDIALTKNFYNR
ncbi:MAG: site-specific DNA-methyltransferase [Candidatus Gracilibacteria bacterium]